VARSPYSYEIFAAAGLAADTDVFVVAGGAYTLIIREFIIDTSAGYYKVEFRRGENAQVLNRYESSLLDPNPGYRRNSDFHLVIGNPVPENPAFSILLYGAVADVHVSGYIIDGLRSD
jgi:hypothetical protein